jgi:RimJ/RimL family protein N-acetyltransferase
VHITVRAGRRDDAAAIKELYRTVAATPGGIARAADEITDEYVRHFVESSIERGIILVADLPGSTKLAGEIHAYRSDVRAFQHSLGELTIAIHPDAQGQGLGRRIFTQLLDEVRRNHPDITRVELITSEYNTRAQRLYESLGFRREGRMERRFRSSEARYEADIPMAWLR